MPPDSRGIILARWCLFRHGSVAVCLGRIRGQLLLQRSAYIYLSKKQRSSSKLGHLIRVTESLWVRIVARLFMKELFAVVGDRCGRNVKLFAFLVELLRYRLRTEILMLCSCREWILSRMGLQLLKSPTEVF
jgi:hypothetical protein